MYYVSTRDSSLRMTAAQAIEQGLSRDGGLFLPEYLPQLPDLKTLLPLSYMERAVVIMKLFLDEFSEEELRTYAQKAYGLEKFDCPEVAPVRRLTDRTSILELWHGPTCAFKDMALQMLPYLLTASMKKNGEDKTVCILVATSGDTGKAALEGFRDVDHTKILVFYPKDGVSDIQKLQMVTQEGNNVGVCAVHGNFDDAQTGVKKIFADKEFAKELDAKGYQFSSANSINIGRLIPQVVYYVYSYGIMLKEERIQAGEKINVVVPTGNFGNILAAYLAKHMGVPIDKLICASNHNKVLYDFFRNGEYNRNREFYLTTSPSMDILISSNLERLIYLIAGEDDEKNKELMKQLSENGSYTITDKMKEGLSDFVGGYATEEQTAQRIKDLYEKTGYVLDTHTAVASYVYEQYVKETGDTNKTVIASTASPFKFGQSVMEAIDGKEHNEDMFELVETLSKTANVAVPTAVSELKTAPVLHDHICEKDGMKDIIREFLNM